MTIFIDIDRGESVGGPESNLAVALPPFTQGDTIEALRIVLLKDFDGTSYTVLPVAGTTLEAALGKKQGTAPASYYTQQFTWTASTDLGNPYWEADFPLNTAGIDTLLGTSTAAKTFFSVKKITSGVGKTVLTKQVTVNAQVIHDSTLTVPAGLTPLSAEAANAAFLGKAGSNELRILNPDTGKGFRIYADADGAYQIEQIT